MKSAQPASDSRWLRGLALAVGLAAAALSAGLLLQVPIATQAWPVSVTPLTYTFLSAYVFGLVAALMWIAATTETSGWQGIGLTTAVAFGSMSIVLLGMTGGRPELAINVVVTLGMCAGGLVLFGLGLRQPVRDGRLTPAALRVACLIVAALLLTLGGPLILRVGDVMPWTLDLDSGALIGCLFLGSSAYFIYGGLRREWPHAAGPFAALLAYDLVLTIPLIAHFSTVRPEHMTVLMPYVMVLVSTALLGAYIFLVDRHTRLGTTSGD